MDSRRAAVGPHGSGSSEVREVCTAIMSKSFESSRAPEPVGAFPHAKRVGNLLFLSGIGPRVRGSKKIPGVTLDSSSNIVRYDIEAQCRAEIGRASCRERVWVA